VWGWEKPWKDRGTSGSHGQQQQQQQPADTPPPPLACTMSAVMGRRVKELAKLCKAQLAQGAASVRRPLRRLWRPLWLRFTYVTSVLVKKY
jgi:hypothetical protein